MLGDGTQERRRTSDLMRKVDKRAVRKLPESITNASFSRYVTTRPVTSLSCVARCQSTPVEVVQLRKPDHRLGTNVTLTGGPECTFEQTSHHVARMLSIAMNLHQIKISVSAVWMFIATVIAIAVDMSWMKGLMIASFGVLPPLALLLLWNEPAPTMSESIHDARR